MPIKKPEKEKLPQTITERRRYERNLENLIKQLESPLPAERRWAAVDLSKYPSASKALLERLKREEDISVRGALLNSLYVLKSEEVARELIECLKSEDVLLRNEVIETLKNMPEEVSPFIEELLKSPDPDLRIFAINIMESLKHPKVIEWLKEVMLRDAHINVCGAALNLAFELGAEELIEAIQRVKERFPEEPYIQFSADLALKG